MAKISYRPELDGLRALAVIPVVLFHLELGVGLGRALTGGYVGVDIFFVISGFLITTLILKDLQAGTFSLRQFWERRIRRIMPAACVAVAAAVVIGLFLLLPSDLEDLGKSAVAQALLGANVYFYATAGYFSAPAETKPLLHFWSLAVEEQFYLLFPFLLLFLWQKGRSAFATAGVAVVALLSFALSVVGAFRFPDATFYLLPARAWELALGALLALRGGHLPLPERWQPVAGWVGLPMMLLPVFFYDATTPFPGLAAVPPCLGAVLVIGATRQDGWLKRLLSVRPLVFLGLISYSLYLWHWPVQVYSHYWMISPSSLVTRVLVFLASVVLAWMSWRWVEQPFRKRRVFENIRPLMAFAGGVTAAVVGVGLLLSFGNGLPKRLPQEVVQFAAAYDDRPSAEEADITLEQAQSGELPSLSTVAGKPRLLLWGDSHARVVAPAVEEVAADLKLPGVRASRSGTPALLDWGDESAQAHNRAILEWVKANRPDVVLLVARWEAWLKDESDEARLVETVRTLSTLGPRVLLMRQVPSLGHDVPRALARAALAGEQSANVGLPVEEHLAFAARSNAALDRAAQEVRGVMVLDPLPFLTLNGICVAEMNGHPLYYDRQHLTRSGAVRLKPLFRDALAATVRHKTQHSSSVAPGMAIMQPHGQRLLDPTTE